MHRKPLYKRTRNASENGPETAAPAPDVLPEGLAQPLAATAVVQDEQTTTRPTTGYTLSPLRRLEDRSKPCKTPENGIETAKTGGNLDILDVSRPFRSSFKGASASASPSSTAPPCPPGPGTSASLAGSRGRRCWAGTEARSPAVCHHIFLAYTWYIALQCRFNICITYSVSRFY